MSKRKMRDNGWLTVAPTEHTRHVMALKRLYPSKEAMHSSTIIEETLLHSWCMYRSCLYR